MSGEEKYESAYTGDSHVDDKNKDIILELQQMKKMTENVEQDTENANKTQNVNMLSKIKKDGFIGKINPENYDNSNILSKLLNVFLFLILTLILFFVFNYSMSIKTNLLFKMLNYKK